jgi:hypothetical protein
MQSPCWGYTGMTRAPLERGARDEPRQTAQIPEERDVLVRPFPSELTAPINPDRGVEGHRNLFCSYYDGCLDEAVKKGWNSWSCMQCQLFAVQPDVEQGLEGYATQRRIA